MAYQSSILYDVYDEEVTEQAKNNEDIWMVDADAIWMTQNFLTTFPQRCVNVGIAEQNMIGMAAGIASMGKIVFANTMATFLTMRSIEQIKVDVIYNRFNVKVVSSFSGVLGGPWGSTHHGLEDIAFCRTLPNMKVIIPADAYEVRGAVQAAVADESPMYIRLEREEPVERDGQDFKLGKAVTFSEGRDITLIATGSMVSFSQQAAKILASKGIEAGVINMHTIKPIDHEAVLRAGVSTGSLVTVEEHQVIGGLGSAVAEVIAEKAPDHIKLKRIGFEDTLVEIVGSYSDILRHYKLMPENIAEKTEEFLNTVRK